MISPYQSLITYQQDEWEDYLSRCLLIDIFRPVIEEYPDKQVLKCVIRYITYAYTLQSDKIVIGKDWLENKKEIFEYVQVHPMLDLYDDLVLLKNRAVVETVHLWLKFQDNESFAQLKVLKDLRTEMQVSALTRILKSSGEVDYDQKYRNANYAGDLRAKIKELEAELVQNDKNMKEAVKEVRAAKSRYNVSPETFSK